MGLFSKISIPPEQPAVGNLNSIVQPSFPLRYAVEHSQKSTDTSLGYTIIWNKQRTRVKQYDLVWQNVNKAERDTIQTFFDTRFGEEIPFLWSPPGVSLLSPEKYYFIDDLTERKKEPNVYTLRTRIEQLEPVDLVPAPVPDIIGPLNETIEYDRTEPPIFAETIEYTKEEPFIGQFAETAQYNRNIEVPKFGETVEYDKELPEVLFGETIQYTRTIEVPKFNETVEYDRS